MPIRMRVFPLFLALLPALPLQAQESDPVTRTWLFGAGSTAIYDAYLSPLDYQGPGISVTMITEKRSRWSHRQITDSLWHSSIPRLSTYHILDITAATTKNPKGNAHIYDAQLSFAAGWHYNWLFHPGARQRIRLRAGGLLELTGGGSFSTRNGNNPGQGRAALDIAASVIADYSFPSPFRRQQTPWTLRVAADAPLAGVMFTPQYGQSYYELFELGHYNGNVVGTWPGNVPSARLFATLSIPVGRAHLAIGYRGEARQSEVHSLTRHSWYNGFVIGFTRNFHF